MFANCRKSPFVLVFLVFYQARQTTFHCWKQIVFSFLAVFFLGNKTITRVKELDNLPLPVPLKPCSCFVQKLFLPTKVFRTASSEESCSTRVSDRNKTNKYLRWYERGACSFPELRFISDFDLGFGLESDHKPKKIASKVYNTIKDVNKLPLICFSGLL